MRSGETDETSDSAISEALSEQITALAEAGPDGIILETFSRLAELEIALQTALKICDLPIIAQLSVDEAGFTRDGQHIVPAFERLRKIGAHVVGVNCAKGPTGILRALEQVSLDDNLLLSAFPNAGLPAMVDGRYMYLSTPEYFAESALRLRDQGVRLIGGCCGTTPEHTRAIADAVRNLPPVTKSALALSASLPGRRRQHWITPRACWISCASGRQ